MTNNILKWIFCKIFRRKYIIISLPSSYGWQNENRVVALRDIPRHNVRKHDIGGSVEGYHNLSQFGDCWVGENGIVCGKARVSGNVIVRSHAKVHGDAKIKGQAIVYGRAEVFGHAKVKETAEIYGQAMVYEHALVKGRSYIHGDARLYGNCTVSGKTVIRDKSKICDLAIVHDSDISGGTIIRNDARVVGRKICDIIIFS